MRRQAFSIPCYGVFTLSDTETDTDALHRDGHQPRFPLGSVPI